MIICTIKPTRMEFSTGIYRTQNRIIIGFDYQFQYHVFYFGYIMDHDCTLGDNYGWNIDG